MKDQSKRNAVIASECDRSKVAIGRSSMKLDESKRCIMAAILGISNLGMDNTFLGPRAQWTPEKVGEYYRNGKDRRWGQDIESAVVTFGRGFLENDQMAEMFYDESRSWYDMLETEEDVIKTRYGTFLEAMK